MVDRIGKGGGAPPPTPGAGGAGGAGPADKAAAPERPFQVERPDPAHAKAPVDPTAPVTGPTPLQRLRAGEIDVNGYIDLKVDEATKHLPVPAADLEEIKKTLRDQMTTDPALADLVRAATGHTPAPPED